MINLKLQIILLVSTASFAVVVFSLIRRGHLEIKYSLIWMLAVFSFILLPLRPRVLEYVAELFGIVDPVNALFLVGIIFLILIVFSLTVALSKNSNRLRNITQELALLRLKVEKIEEK